MATKRAPKKKKVHCLILWLEEDAVGIVPESNIKSGQTAAVGAIAEFKFKQKYYDARVLKMSG